MVSPAFIVEGQTEQRFLQKVCPTAKVIILGCNGKKVSCSAIANRIAAYFRILNNRYYPVVVLFDRETRAESCSVLMSDLEEELKARGLDEAQFRIGIVDRKIETWMLYSVDEHGGPDPTCQHSDDDEFEGATGEGELMRRLRKVDVEYHKTTVGVDLLHSLDAAALAKKSTSFRDFRSKLSFPCDWLRQRPTKVKRA
jgi:hypothetical protein